MKKLLVTVIALTFSTASFGMNAGCEYHTFRSGSPFVDMTMVHTSICKGEVTGYHPGQKIKFIYYGNPNTPNLKPFSGDLIVRKGSPFSIGRGFDYTFKGHTANKDIRCKAIDLNKNGDPFVLELGCNVKLVVGGEISQRNTFIVPMVATMKTS